MTRILCANLQRMRWMEMTMSRLQGFRWRVAAAETSEDGHMILRASGLWSSVRTCAQKARRECHHFLPQEPSARGPLNHSFCPYDLTGVSSGADNLYGTGHGKRNAQKRVMVVRIQRQNDRGRRWAVRGEKKYMIYGSGERMRVWIQDFGNVIGCGLYICVVADLLITFELVIFFR